LLESWDAVSPDGDLVFRGRSLFSLPMSFQSVHVSACTREFLHDFLFF
jgi:hypothetical protein